jgi:hypothetical protein
MELEIINKLYLELSQVATAKTLKEIALEKRLEKQKLLRKLVQDIFNCEEYDYLPVSIKSRIQDVMDGKEGDS